MVKILLVTLFFIFDFYAFLVGTHPQTSAAYRGYYIDHSIDLKTYIKKTKSEIK